MLSPNTSPNTTPRSKAPLRSRPPDPHEKVARIILHSIQSELRGADFFTREDLLQLRVLQSVATITRYRMVCESVHWLLSNNYILPLSRTEFRTPATKHRGQVFGPTLAAQYTPTIKRLISSQHRKPFDLVDLLSQWTTDPHLTTNAKRVVIRTVLKSLHRTGALHHTNSFMVFRAPS